jgi:hypothetical protein
LQSRVHGGQGPRQGEGDGGAGAGKVEGFAGFSRYRDIFENIHSYKANTARTGQPSLRASAGSCSLEATRATHNFNETYLTREEILELLLSNSFDSNEQ